MMLHGAVQCCACFCLKTGQNQPTSVIVRFIPYQFMQFDIKALRNEAAEQRQQTLHRKTQGFNLQELHKFSKLMLFKNIYPDYLPLTGKKTTISPYSFSRGQYKSSPFPECTKGQYFTPVCHLSFQNGWCGVMNCHLLSTDEYFVATGAFLN